MKHPAFIAADIVEAVSKTRGYVIDWAEEIERGITTALDERDGRIAALEAALAESKKYNTFSSQYEEYISGEAFNAMEGYIQEKARAEKAEAENKELRKTILNMMYVR